MSDFSHFVRQYQDMVFSTALRLTADRGDAEDIAQETFLKAHRAFASLAGRPEAGGWLRTTARNLALNHVTRYRRRFVFVGSGADSAALEPEPAEADASAWLYDQTEWLKRALLDLPRKFRVPLVLYYYEGMDYAGIAAALGISLPKVKTDILRGRRRLRQMLEQLEGHHGTA